MATDDELSRGERTRVAILEAAQELFLENGYSGTSMRQIAERAGGIAVGGIYNHFSSKEDIFRHLVEERNPYQLLHTALAEAEGETGPQLLADALRRIQAIAIVHIDFIQLAYVDIQNFDGRAMLGVVESVLPVAIRFAQRVMAAGGLRPDLAPLVMMRLFISLLIGFALTERVGFLEGRPRLDRLPNMSQDEWAAALVDLFLYGVAAEG